VPGSSLSSTQKKKKLNEEATLTALVALHKYCHRFKLGTPGFREKSQNPFLICVVIDGGEFGAAKHVEKSAAMERASLLTLNLLDPEGKSLLSNVDWANEAEVRGLQLKVVNCTQDSLPPPAPLFMPSPLVPKPGQRRAVL